MNYGMIPISQIHVGPRARESVGDVGDIVQTAKGFAGQIQSLAVCRCDDSDQPYELLAGRRRLEGFSQAGITNVLCIIYPESLSDAERKTIELVENLARLSMTWQDTVVATMQIHDLQKTINPRWTKLETAQLLGRSEGVLVQDLALAEAVTKIPQLDICKTKAQAVSFMTKAEELLLLGELAERRKSAIANGDALDAQRLRMVDSYQIGDAFELIKRVESNSIDFIDLDPDYAIDFKSFRGHYESEKSRGTHVTKTSDYTEINPVDYRKSMDAILEECYRVLKPDSWIVVWYACNPWAETTFGCLIRADFKLSRLPAIWCKYSEGIRGVPSMAPDIYLGRTHENFYYARKGKAVITNRGRPDVFHYEPPTSANRIHPTEKPLDLMEEILRTFCIPGAQVLVPFLGSGNTILAAANVGMEATGFDLSTEYKNAFTLRALEWQPPQEEEEDETGENEGP